MKNLFLGFSILVVFTACGKNGESSTESARPANETSTTPPPTADSTHAVGIMMGDTSITAADSLNPQK